jgi:hypothetical protein
LGLLLCFFKDEADADDPDDPKEDSEDDPKEDSEEDMFPYIT